MSPFDRSRKGVGGRREGVALHARMLVALTCLAATAAASDHPEEARKLALKDVRGQSLSWTVNVPPPVVPAASPVVVGATLELRARSGETASFDLPASGWSADDAGTRFRFENPLAPGGPSAVKSATFKSQRVIKVRTKATGLTLDEPTQGVVSIALTIGDDVYCSTCVTPTHDQPGRYTAKRCPAPASCPSTSTTSTSTSTSTTTSSFVPGVCGNGVVDQPSEQCDLPDPGICANVSLPVPITCGAPTSSTPCVCCGPTSCFFGAFGDIIGCCGSAACQDVTGVGAVREGACIPPSCTQDADCNGYRCVGGTCCGEAGSLCGVVSCCPGSEATCDVVPWIGGRVCCRSPGVSCSVPNECCSHSCTAGTCD